MRTYLLGFSLNFVLSVTNAIARSLGGGPLYEGALIRLFSCPFGDRGMSLRGSRRVCTPSFFSTQGKKIAKKERRGREERTVIVLGF